MPCSSAIIHLMVLSSQRNNRHLRTDKDETKAQVIKKCQIHLINQKNSTQQHWEKFIHMVEGQRGMGQIAWSLVLQSERFGTRISLNNSNTNRKMVWKHQPLRLVVITTCDISYSLVRSIWSHGFFSYLVRAQLCSPVSVLPSVARDAGATVELCTALLPNAMFDRFTGERTLEEWTMNLLTITHVRVTICVLFSIDMYPR